MSISALGVCLLVSAVTSQLPHYQHLQPEFGEFKDGYNKLYEHPVEEKYRLMIYADKKHAIDKHNARYEQGLETYQVALNQYSDLLHHEFLLAKACMVTVDEAEDLVGGAYEAPVNLSALPDEVDWRKVGAVTEVKDQGQCGSCWAFSITGTVEGQNFKKSGKLVPLSEQELIDCSPYPGKGGCDGNVLPPVYEYIKKAGIDTEISYPYEGVNGKECRHDDSNVGATITGYVVLPANDEVKLQEAVATVGPIAVLIHVSPSFQSYSSGVYYEPTCTGEPNHAVLVVGYGTDPDAGDYWLVKNTWGPNWGEEGYIKMARNKDNHCKIALAPSYPTV